MAGVRPNYGPITEVLALRGKISVMTSTTTAWDTFVVQSRQSAVRQGAPHPVILESWQRCEDVGVHRNGEIQFRQVSVDDLLLRRRQNQALLQVSAGLIDDFSESLDGIKHVIYVTDADGIVLYSRGNDALMKSFGLRPGFDWSERTMGTNGAGTALACNRPVAVIGPEHWKFPFQDAACIAAPIRHPDGFTVAAVDLSLDVDDCRPEQMGQIIALAQQIEIHLGAILYRDGATA